MTEFTVETMKEAYRKGFEYANMEAPGKKITNHSDEWFKDLMSALVFNNPEIKEEQVLEVIFDCADKISNSGQNGKDTGLRLQKGRYKGPSDKGLTMEQIDQMLELKRSSLKKPEEVPTESPESARNEQKDYMALLRSNDISVTQAVSMGLRGIAEEMATLRRQEFEERKKQQAILEQIKAEKARKLLSAYETNDIKAVIESPVHRNGWLKIDALKEAIPLILAKMTVAFWGPKGTGKTEALVNFTKDMNWDFKSITAPMYNTDLQGFVNAKGEIVDTEFIKAFTAPKEKPTMFLFEEIDRALPEALIAINSALANGFMNTPDGIKYRGEGCYIAFSANTNGQGGTTEYATANQLDGSTIDRAVWFYVGYQESVFQSIAPENPELVSFAMDMIQSTTKLKLDSAVSMTYRTVTNIVKEETVYDTLGMFKSKKQMTMHILSNAMVKGASAATIRSVVEGLQNKENSYARAFADIPREMGGSAGVF